MQSMENLASLAEDLKQSEPKYVSITDDLMKLSWDSTTQCAMTKCKSNISNIKCTMLNPKASSSLLVLIASPSGNGYTTYKVMATKHTKAFLRADVFHKLHDAMFKCKIRCTNKYLFRTQWICHIQ